jgi:DNA-binding response OmpR family regulator
MFRPHIVLLDIGLPDMSDYDVIRHLRELAADADIKIVALTGWGTPSDHERSHRAGFDHHLTKRVSLAALLRVIEGYTTRDPVDRGGTAGTGALSFDSIPARTCYSRRRWCAKRLCSHVVVGAKTTPGISTCSTWPAGSNASAWRT